MAEVEVEKTETGPENKGGLSRWRLQIECSRCASQERERSGERIKLVGVYHTRLCNECSNDWHEHLCKDDLWDSIHNADTDMEVSLALLHSGNRMSESDYRMAKSNRRRVEALLFDVAHVWCKGEEVE